MTALQSFKEIYKSNRDEKEKTYDTRKNRQIQSQVIFKKTSHENKLCNQNKK